MKKKLIEEYRFATDEDLKNINNDLLNEDFKILRRLGHSGYDGSFSDNGSNKVSIVGLINGEIVCVGRVSGSDSTSFNYLSFFYVYPAFRKKGIGKEFLKYLLKYVYDQWSGAGIDLFTIENPDMESLIKKEGFIFSGVYKKRYKNNDKFYDESRWYKLYN